MRLRKEPVSQRFGLCVLCPSRSNILLFLKVAFGGGWRGFRPTTYTQGTDRGKRTDSLDLIQEWSARYGSMGTAKYVSTKSELDQIDVDGTDYVLGRIRSLFRQHRGEKTTHTK